MYLVKNVREREEILKALELNMNEEIKATLQYICHRISAKSKAPLIAESFKSAALDEMAHILYFSDFIEKYGGTPRFQKWEIDRSSEVKTMLEADVLLEKLARGRYQNQLERFKEYPELTSLISGIVSDEEDHELLFTKYLKEASFP